MDKTAKISYVYLAFTFTMYGNDTFFYRKCVLYISLTYSFTAEQPRNKYRYSDS